MRPATDAGSRQQVLIDVGEDGREPFVENRVIARDERQRCADDLVALLPPDTAL